MDFSSVLGNFMLTLPVFLFSLSVHEAAHAWVALRCGDPTARDLGRVTLNPVPHIDVVGTLLMPLLSVFSGGLALIGWAKPVPVDWRNLGDPRRDDTLIAIAGPISNVILSVFALIALAIVILLPLDFGEGGIGTLLIKIFRYGVIINIALAVFNMIPIPPLDGSHVLGNALPPDLAEKYQAIGAYGFFILIILFNVPPVRAFFGGIIRSILSVYFSFLPGM